MQNDQSFTSARERFAEARAALEKRQYDSAEMKAKEAALLAELAAEKAKLRALQTSYNNMMRATSTVAPRY